MSDYRIGDTPEENLKRLGKLGARVDSPKAYEDEQKGRDSYGNSLMRRLNKRPNPDKPAWSQKSMDDEARKAAATSDE